MKLRAKTCHLYMFFIFYTIFIPLSQPSNKVPIKIEEFNSQFFFFEKQFNSELRGKENGTILLTFSIIKGSPSLPLPSFIYLLVLFSCGRWRFICKLKSLEILK